MENDLEIDFLSPNFVSIYKYLEMKKLESTELISRQVNIKERKKMFHNKQMEEFFDNLITENIKKYKQQVSDYNTDKKTLLRYCLFVSIIEEMLKPLTSYYYNISLVMQEKVKNNYLKKLNSVPINNLIGNIDIMDVRIIFQDARVKTNLIITNLEELEKYDLKDSLEKLIAEIMVENKVTVVIKEKEKNI